MEPLVSVARRPSVAARCAFCHDALGDEWDVCSGCNTRLHTECRATAIDCPTLGCRMSALRLHWTAPGLRPRPAFRRALASMAERRESDRLGLALHDEADDGDGGSSWPTLLLLVHGVLSPVALLGFAVFFVGFFAPAHWAGTLLRRRILSDRARALVQGPGTMFSFEAAAAPFAVLAATCVAIPSAGAVASPVEAGLAFVGALVVLLVPALGWFDPDC